MSDFDYVFTLDDLVDGYSTVTLTKSQSPAPTHVEVFLDDSRIHHLNGRFLSSIQADLLDLATAIHIADKLALPKKSRSIQTHINLPLRNPTAFTQAHKQLCDLMFWYTGDFWSFQFTSRKVHKRISEQQSTQRLIFCETKKGLEVALWSGGLDSLAGLQNRMLENQHKRFLLIGTGSNSIMHKRQREVFHTLHLTPPASGRLNYLHIPINVQYGQRYSKNSSHRARGIVFLLIGAAFALAVKSQRLHVYETGIGAINLPLPSGIGRDHSKAVHPISLIDVGEFISSLVKSDFSIENPFIFRTKAEMCRSLQSNLLPIFETISCDRLHREKYIQCGYCSSCILRRQALASARIKDQTKYLIPHGRYPEPRHHAYWKKMDHQIDTIERILESPDWWYQICTEYCDLPDIVNHMAKKQLYEENEIKENLNRLYKTYVREWRDVAYSIFEKATNLRKTSYPEEKKWQQMCLIK